MRSTWILMGLMAAVLLADGANTPAAAQSADIEASIEECTTAAADEQQDRMESAAARLEAAASAVEAERTADALVIRARVRLQCWIPFSNKLRQAMLLDESIGLLEQALDMEPEHLLARFVLAMSHYRSPTFLGRTPDAIREFERLLEVHGHRVEPIVAQAYLYLGDLYEREGRAAQAAQVWSRGSARFPDDAELRTKVWSVGPDTIAVGTLASPEGMIHTLAPIIVQASTYSIEDPRTPMRLSKQEVYTLPGGMADVFQVFQTMPGMTRVSGDGGDLYVRGGDPAETPIYVDGARLFHAGRFETLNGSIFGVLDQAVMRTAYFSSGGFSARYGDALSGVVALETDPRPFERSWRASVNLASVGGTLWQPLGEHAGVWGTGMLTHTGLLLDTHGRTEDYPESPTSTQLMVGVEVEPHPGLTVRATALNESDRTTVRASSGGYDGDFHSEAVARLATAQVRAATADGRALARLTLATSMRETHLGFGVLARDREDRSMDARLDGQLSRDGVVFRAGIEAALLDAMTEGTIPAAEELAPGSPVVQLDRETAEADHLGGYTEVEWRLSSRIALIAGLRTDEAPGETERTVDPRLAAAYKVDDWTFRIAAGRFSQGRWRTRYALPNGGSPTGIPLRARHLVAGIQHDGGPSVTAEAWIKSYDDYIDESGTAAVGPRAISGRAVGFDVLLQPEAWGPLEGWLTYSYLHGELELEDGARVPSPYDVTHSLTAVAKLSIAVSELGLTARYATGKPYTPIVGAAAPEPGRPVAPIYGPLHSARMPQYFRLDGRLTQLLPAAGGVLAVYVEALNLLGRRNITMYTYDAAYRDSLPVPNFFGDRTFVLGLEARF